MNDDLDADRIHRLTVDPATVLGQPAADAIRALLQTAPPLGGDTTRWLRAQFAQPVIRDTPHARVA